MDGDAKAQEDYDDRMIAMVRKCPFLFDKNRPDFKDPEKRQRTWEAIGAALGQRADAVERRWVSLRNQYTKKIREEQTIPSAGLRAYTWRPSMAWLKPYIKGRRRRKDMVPLRGGSMTNGHDHFMSPSNRNNFYPPNPSHYSEGNHPLGVLPNLILPRSMEVSLVPSSQNGGPSTSSLSPTWSQSYAEITDEDVSPESAELQDKAYSYTQPEIIGDAALSPLQNSTLSENEDSHEFKPGVNELQNNFQRLQQNDFMSMMTIVREVVRQEMGTDDEDTHFAKSIAGMLRRMGRSKKNRAKVKLLQVLSDIDEGNE